MADYCMQQIDGIPFQTREAVALDWLAVYGRVFQVLDQQPSGNLCFGVAGPYGRLFIKYAGARTINFMGRPEDAVATLRNAMPLYARTHPALTQLLAHGQAGEGYAAVFRWRDAPPLCPTPPDGATLARVRALQLSRSLKMLDMVFDLHVQLAADGYIAVDFSDGNLLIDFDRDEAVVCDIDLYRRKPAFNDRGRMPGASRFMAPEEFRQGQRLTECTTVYNMGALAFAFFGDPLERSSDTWQGPAALYPVALRAMAEQPFQRYPTLKAFQEAWREAVGNSWLR